MFMTLISDMTWYTLHEEYDRKLLLLEDIIVNMPFNKSGNCNNYECSDIKTYLYIW